MELFQVLEGNISIVPQSALRDRQNLRFTNLLNRDTLNLGNNMGNASNSHRLISALDHKPLLPLLLLH